MSHFSFLNFIDFEGCLAHSRNLVFQREDFCSLFFRRFATFKIYYDFYAHLNPKIEDFIHRVYIISARKIYKNVYLFEKNIPPLQVQKNNRELELLVQESILNAVRESIPVDVLLRTYLDETIEEDVEINIHEEVLDQPIEEETPTSRYLDTTATLSSGPIDETITEPIEKTRLSFSNLDKTNTLENDDYEKEISTPEPKEVKSLEEDVSGDKLVISSSDAVSLTHTDVHDLDPPSIEVIPDLLIDDIEVI